MREWVPDTHIVHFILDALDHVPMAVAKVNARGTGSAQYPPLMMLGLLIFGYITGRFSSREIEAATSQRRGHALHGRESPSRP